MTLGVWDDGVARAVVELRDDVMVLTGCGIVTPARWRQASRHIVKWMRHENVSVVLNDLSRAVLAFDEEEGRALAAEIASGAPGGMPGALVVAEPYISIAVRLAWEMAQRGVVRIVFPRYGQAWEWARQEVRHCRRARQS